MKSASMLFCRRNQCNNVDYFTKCSSPFLVCSKQSGSIYSSTRCRGVNYTLNQGGIEKKREKPLVLMNEEASMANICLQVIGLQLCSMQWNNKMLLVLLDVQN